MLKEVRRITRNAPQSRSHHRLFAAHRSERMADNLSSISRCSWTLNWSWRIARNVRASQAPLGMVTSCESSNGSSYEVLSLRRLPIQAGEDLKQPRPRICRYGGAYSVAHNTERQHGRDEERNRPEISLCTTLWMTASCSRMGRNTVTHRRVHQSPFFTHGSEHCHA